jgi:hypothetical protein
MALDKRRAILIALRLSLVDVIIFKGLAEASSPSLWAHQMVHVKQFMELGVSGFVIRYFSNRREIEDPLMRLKPNMSDGLAGDPKLALSKAR